MSKQTHKFRGISDKDLLGVLQHHDRALVGAGRVVGTQQGQIRLLALGLLAVAIGFGWHLAAEAGWIATVASVLKAVW